MINRILDRWRKISVEAKASVALIFATFLTRGIGFITTPIYSRLMSTSEYGEMTNYNAWVSVLEPIAILGLTSAGVFNVGLNEYRDSRKQYMSAMLGLCNVMTVLLFGIIELLKLFGAPFSIVSDSLMPLMIIHFLFSPAQVFWVTRQRYEYRYKPAIIITVLSVIFSQAAALYAVIFLDGNKAVNRLWGNETGAFAIYFILYIYLICSGKSYIKWSYWKNIFMFAVPLIPHYLAQHVMSSSDRIMLVNIQDESMAGIYGLVAYIGVIASIVWNSINASLMPYTYEKMNGKDYRNLDRTVRSVLLPYAIICIFVSLIAPEILWVLAPSEYYSGIVIVPCFAVISFVQALYNVFANIEFYFKKSAYISAATVIATVCNLALNYLLIPRYGFVGASYATLISTIFLVFMHYLGMKKIMKEEKLYSVGKIVAISVVCVFGSMSCNLLYKNNVVRYLVICIILGMAFCLRKRIVMVLKNLK